MHYDYLYYLLNKQAGGAISPEEELILEKWYNSLQHGIPVNAEEVRDGQELVWQSLHARLSENSDSTELKTPVRALWKRWVIAAAVLILITGTALLALFFNKQGGDETLTYSAVETARQKKSVILPDGSKVWINAHSKLRFADGFDKHRNIILDYGEAFFEVTRDTNHPFKVKVNELEVKVLGTSFNIQSFSQLHEIKVGVTHGKVSVCDSLDCQEKILPDQVLTYTRKDHRFTIETIDPQKTNDWKNGVIYLNNISLKELAVYIRNIYDYDVVFVNKDLEQCKNTINFRDKDPLKEVLELLKLINKVKYTIQDKTVYLDGEGCR